MRSEYEQAGISYDPGRTRVERLAEAVAIIKRLLAGESGVVDGPALSRHGSRDPSAPCPAAASADPRRRQWASAPHPRRPGGRHRWPHRHHLRARRDRARPGGMPGQRRRRAGAADRGCGRDPGRAAGPERARAARTRHRRSAARRRGTRRGPLEPAQPDEILESPYALIGTVDQIVEDLRARRVRWGVSSYAIHEPYLDALAPVVERLAGG